MKEQVSSMRLVTFLLLFVFVGQSWAQLSKAVVVGRVEDSSGAVIVGAEVQMKRISTNEIFKTQTTETGDYTLVNLPLDSYEIRVSMSGFNTEVRTGIKLAVGSTSRIDFQLGVGEVTQTVEVSSQAPILKTENAETGQAIDNTKISNLPLNTRDVFGALGALTPGVAPTRNNPAGGAVRFTVRGQRTNKRELRQG